MLETDSTANKPGLCIRENKTKFRKILNFEKQHSTKQNYIFAAEKILYDLVFYDVPMGRYKKIFLADRRIHLLAGRFCIDLWRSAE